MKKSQKKEVKQTGIEKKYSDEEYFKEELSEELPEKLPEESLEEMGVEMISLSSEEEPVLQTEEKHKKHSEPMEKSEGSVTSSSSKKKKRKLKKGVLPILIIIILLLAIFIGGFFYVNQLAYKKVHVECGVEITAGELMKKNDPAAYFTKDSDTINSMLPGEYHVKVHSGFFNHKVLVIMQDTQSPSVEKMDVAIEYGAAAQPEDFVSQVTDATKTVITFAAEPDFTQTGSRNVELKVTDAGENVTSFESTLTILPFRTHLSKEAGGAKPSAGDFALCEEDYTYKSGLDAVDMKHVGTYDIVFSYEGRDYTSVFEVVDTTAPEAEFTNYEGYLGETIKPEYFVVSANDITSLTYALDREIEESEGEKEYTVTVTDEGGNAVSENCKLTLKKDTEPPEVKVLGDIEVYQGNSVSYLNHIEVTDNCEQDLSIEVDSDAVNTDVAGTYPVTYTITDVGGNTVSVSANVIVKERSYSMDEVNARADEILAEILTPDMSDYDKSWAIFDYVRKHVVFQDKSDKDSYVKACYEGIIGNHGDCYVYACASQTLLTRAGIKNMMIERIPTRTTHFWNLVDYGEGWYHFDTTPRVPDHPTVFMWTEAQIQEYSAAHYRCYNYDHDEYPVTN